MCKEKSILKYIPDEEMNDYELLAESRAEAEQFSNIHFDRKISEIKDFLPRRKAEELDNLLEKQQIYFSSESNEYFKLGMKAGLKMFMEILLY